MDTRRVNPQASHGRCCKRPASRTIEQPLMQGTLDSPAIEIAIRQIGGAMGAAGGGDGDPLLTIEHREVIALMVHGCDVARLEFSNRNQVSPGLIISTHFSLPDPFAVSSPA